MSCGGGHIRYLSTQNILQWVIQGKFQFKFWIKCFNSDFHYDFRIKMMFGSSVPPVVCRRTHGLNLHYWCLFAYSDIHYHHDMTELLLKVVSKTVNQTNTHCFALCTLWCHFLWIVQFWKFFPYSLTFIHRIFFKYSPTFKSVFFFFYIIDILIMIQQNIRVDCSICWLWGYLMKVIPEIHCTH